MYPLPEQPEPKTATLRPLPNVDAASPIPLSAPLPDMLSAPLPTAPLTTGPLATGTAVGAPRGGHAADRAGGQSGCPRSGVPGPGPGDLGA